MEKAHPPVFLARNRNGLIEFEDNPVGLFRHIACNADGNMHERQHRDPIAVHVFDFLIEVAPAENVEDKLVAVACPHNDLRGTFRAGYYRVDGVAPDAALIAALAAWCADADHLIRELRTTGGTLEEVYLELTRRSDAASGRAP